MGINVRATQTVTIIDVDGGQVADFFFGNGKGHPNCFDNINRCLGERRPTIQPINIFMNTTVATDGKITISPPRSKAGDRLAMQALMDVRIGIAACSVAEGDCNARKCSAIKVVVE